MARQVGDNGRSKATTQARGVRNQARILELVASGRTITEAAAEVGTTRPYASKLYTRALQAAMDSNAELRQHLLAQDLETLRLLIKAHMVPALGRRVVLSGEDDDGMLIAVEPDAGSARIVLGALDRRAKLLGLDAAIQVEVSQSRINDAVEGIVGLLDDATDQDLAAVLEIDDPSRRAAG